MELRVKTSELKTASSEIIKNAKSYQEELVTIYQLIDSVPEYWHGLSDYQVFLARVNEKKLAMIKVGMILEQYGQLLEDVSNNTSSLSLEVKQVLDKG